MTFADAELLQAKRNAIERLRAEAAYYSAQSDDARWPMRLRDVFRLHANECRKVISILGGQ